MFTLMIEHPVADFDSWKAAFDSDPAGRKPSGVLRYRVFRPLDDPRYVLVHLDFAGATEAQAFLASMRKIWGRVSASLGLTRELGSDNASPRARVVEVVESKEIG